MKIRKKEALDYHERGKSGKIEVIPTKPYSSQRDLSLAYSPGVAEPCLEIEKNPEKVYNYTAKGNLVAVISNGTAVLGLGDIGPEASKPVMEGKGLLFKIFADIDVFDIEVDASDVDLFVQTVKAIAPTFGGINLEDLKAPEAFEIERRLKKELNIPVMHDDQHGTAIISGAALINALEIAEKKIGEVKIVVNGAGASAISCTKLYLALGAKKENIIMLDSKGVIRKSRKNLSKEKKFFASNTEINTLEEAINNADVFLGLSKGNILTKPMVKSMAPHPIIFALANPDPEIAYQKAIAFRDDLIMATGRSDNPNQVNNVLGFPYIFRGALDVRAKAINEEMKLAAVKAIANLAKEPVPDKVLTAYDEKAFSFGKDYIIPKPLDYRLITTVAPAVAKAAMESGVARIEITDWEEYQHQLNSRMGLDNKLLRNITQKARSKAQKVVFAEADDPRILRAIQIAKDEGVVKPILLGKEDNINRLIEEYEIDLGDVEIIDPRSDELRSKRDVFADQFFERRNRKGVTHYESVKLMRDIDYFGAMMLANGEADAMISGLTRKYADVIKPALQIIGADDSVSKVAGMYILMTKKGPFFFADTTINLDPTEEELKDIVQLVVNAVSRLKIKPRIAMLSYSNFGSSSGADAQKVRNVVKWFHENKTEISIDGEIQANFALNKELLKENFPFSQLNGQPVNTLIFPNLASGNIAYKLVQEITNNEAVGPILLGLKKPYHVLQMGSSEREIVNMIKIAVVDAQTRKK